MQLDAISSYLPYTSNGGLVEGLNIDVRGFKGLTIIVGRNASGKTALLESIGYSMALLGDTQYTAQSLELLKTMRPTRSLPSIFTTSIQQGRRTVAGIMIRLDPLGVEKMLDNLRKKDIIWHEMITRKTYTRLTRDTNRILSLLYEAKRRSRRRVRRRPRGIDQGTLSQILKEVLGSYEIHFFSSSTGRRSQLLRPILVRDAYLAYTMQDGKLFLAMLVFDTRGGPLVAVKPGLSRLPGSMMVFHPGFAYFLRVFTLLYMENVEKGLPREDEAVQMLQSFIPWLNGFELVGRTLYVKSRHEGKRLNINRLSDGQRAAALLGLLYAMAPRGSVVLIDTPEAFVHPDGIDTVAKLIARMVHEGNQVLVATQSAEMLREILSAANSEDVLEDTVVKHLQIREGRVVAKGSWEGSAAYGMVSELSLDLRRA